MVLHHIDHLVDFGLFAHFVCSGLTGDGLPLGFEGVLGLDGFKGFGEGFFCLMVAKCPFFLVRFEQFHVSLATLIAHMSL